MKRLDWTKIFDMCHELQRPLMTLRERLRYARLEQRSNVPDDPQDTSWLLKPYPLNPRPRIASAP